MSKRSAVVVTDIETDQRFFPWRDLARLRVYRSVLIAPLFRGSDIIGLLYFTRQEPGGFTTDETQLVRSFADQAIIAIENARLFEEVQARTAELTQRTQELTESLEYQTATSKVLSVIGSSPGDLAPVFDATLTNAVRLCVVTTAMSSSPRLLSVCRQRIPSSFRSEGRFGQPPKLPSIASCRQESSFTLPTMPRNNIRGLRANTAARGRLSQCPCIKRKS